MLKLLKRLFILGLIGAAAYALWKKVTGVGQATTFADSLRSDLIAPPTSASNASAVVSTPSAPATSESWVDSDDGACPVSHPIKGKVGSGIFHVPGGQNYDRTRADRCYPSAASAEADGLRQAKR